MFVLTRRLGESLIIGNDIIVTVSDIKNGQIKLGINAPKDVIICREEVFKKIKAENMSSSDSGVLIHIKE